MTSHLESQGNSWIQSFVTYFYMDDLKFERVIFHYKNNKSINIILRFLCFLVYLNILLRPVAFTFRSSLHSILKGLTRLLHFIWIRLCKYFLGDLFELIDYLWDVNVKEKVYSFVLDSLFTDLSLRKTIDILLDYISLTNISRIIFIMSRQSLVDICW